MSILIDIYKFAAIMSLMIIRYIAILIFCDIFFCYVLFNTNQRFSCQINPELATNTNLPVIYGITPTFTRLTQKADLTRLSQTLMSVKNFHWIVIEDSERKTSLVERLLQESTLNYTHLNVKSSIPKPKKKGLIQRNLALDWLRKHLAQLDDIRGYVYFMDDDNTYSLKIFDEIRKVRQVGVWPVGFVGGMRVEFPLVKDGKVTGFNAVWKPFRPFPIDMAGFAINCTVFLQRPEAKFSEKGKLGFQESDILGYFTKADQLEPLADNCTKVYVWHTKTHTPSSGSKKLKYPDDKFENSGGEA